MSFFICNKIIYDEPFKLRYCSDRYNTQEMCNKAADDFLPALNLFPIDLLQVKND